MRALGFGRGPCDTDAEVQAVADSFADVEFSADAEAETDFFGYFCTLQALTGWKVGISFPDEYVRRDSTDLLYLSCTFERHD